MKPTLVMIMAGGRGSRLAPLTCHRAKPAVPIGGRYRIIDFVLSNFVNAGYHRIYVLTQYMASSLIRHLSRHWHLNAPGLFVEVVPAQMRRGDQWYQGTADSVFQNLNLIDDYSPDHIAVFGGDHVYVMDVEQMENRHLEANADLTIAAVPVPIEEATEFGVIRIDAAGRVLGFQEKPARPAEIPGRPGWALASMGNYFFRREVLQNRLVADSRDPKSAHDFGRNVIPGMLKDGLRIFTYDFSTNEVRNAGPGQKPYWRDVGTLDSFFDVNMDMRKPLPPVDMYNRQWKIRSARRDFPPARFVGKGGRVCEVIDSMVCEGSIITAAHLENVMAGYDCFVHAGSEIRDSVLLSGCNVGAGARLAKVMLDKNCSVEPGTVIGEDPDLDAARFPFVTETGIYVFPKGTHIPQKGPIELSVDMVEALHQDPATRGIFEASLDSFIVAERDRHSHESVGPRFDRYGRLAELTGVIEEAP